MSDTEEGDDYRLEPDRDLSWANKLVYELLSQHRRVGAQCKCGWAKQPMLDMDHRRHIAEKVTVGVLLAVSDSIGNRIAQIRNDALLQEGLQDDDIARLLTERNEALARVDQLEKQLEQTKRKKPSQ